MLHEIVAEAGTGRTFLSILDEQTYYAPATQAQAGLELKTKSILIKLPTITADNWQQQTAEMLNLIAERKMKQISLVCWGAASSVGLNLCLLSPKLVRSIILVDAALRPRSTTLTRLADYLEQFLPLGLPLRLRSKDFDARSLLQRVRAPSLVVSTQQAGEFLRNQAHTFSARLPTAWGLNLNNSAGASEELVTAILEFQNVPARAPQK